MALKKWVPLGVLSCCRPPSLFESAAAGADTRTAEERLERRRKYTPVREVSSCLVVHRTHVCKSCLEVS